MTSSTNVEWTGVRSRRRDFKAAATIFAQGEPATTVLYVVRGAVRLSFLSRTGTQRVTAHLDAGAFFGEGCLAGQLQRVATAKAVAATSVISVERKEMTRQLQSDPAFADMFIAHMLKRNLRIEEDLLDQMLNHIEKRLARTLLLLARYGGPEESRLAIPKVSDELLAEMVGTNRSRINYFMNKFRKLGFIQYNDTLTVNNSLLSVVLND